MNKNEVLKKVLDKNKLALCLIELKIDSIKDKQEIEQLEQIREAYISGLRYGVLDTLEILKKG